jgi:hypothetical protein
LTNVVRRDRPTDITIAQKLSRYRLHGEEERKRKGRIDPT